jgi:hypothetical protein
MNDKELDLFGIGFAAIQLDSRVVVVVRAVLRDLPHAVGLASRLRLTMSGGGMSLLTTLI